MVNFGNFQISKLFKGTAAFQAKSSDFPRSLIPTSPFLSRFNLWATSQDPDPTPRNSPWKKLPMDLDSEENDENLWVDDSWWMLNGYPPTHRPVLLILWRSQVESNLSLTWDVQELDCVRDGAPMQMPSASNAQGFADWMQKASIAIKEWLTGSLL